MWDRLKNYAAGFALLATLATASPIKSDVNYTDPQNYNSQVCMAEPVYNGEVSVMNKPVLNKKKSGKLFNIPDVYYDTITKKVKKYGRVKNNDDLRKKVALVAAVFKCGEHSSGPYTIGKISEKGYSKSAADLLSEWPDPRGPWAQSPAGCSGPGQFIPPTWKMYGIDADGDGIKNINGFEDGIAGMVNYLTANMNPSKSYPDPVKNAVWHYNHSNRYMRQVVDGCYNELLSNPSLMTKKQQTDKNVTNTTAK